MIIVWSGDTGAYFAGKAFGKHKLYEAVSPNKTIEGSLGGIAASIGVAFLFNYLFAFDSRWIPLEAWQVLLLAIPANLLGQLGDLCESIIKRAHDVKDSGTIIPGHGGMLDRIDGLIFASPWVYIFLKHFVVF
jgi:phosphatidate cytidylyltransferase